MCDGLNASPTDIDFAQLEIRPVAEATFHEREQFILYRPRILLDDRIGQKHR